MLLDTNILIYAVTDGSPKQNQSREFIQKNRLSLIVAHQNINEAIRYLTHSKTPKKVELSLALKVLLNSINGLSIISPKSDTIYYMLEMLDKYKIKSNQVFDTYLTATMITNGIRTIATDNVKDFAKFEGIKVINPFK